MVSKIKQFLISRAMIRFYRIAGVGILSAFLIELVDLVPQIVLSDQVEKGIILILAAVLAGLDKKYRDLKSKT